MTMIEQIALATDKVAHWNSKRDHALAMLSKWQGRLTALQSKGKPQPTAAKLPALTIVPGSVRFMPRQAVAKAIRLPPNISPDCLAGHRGGSWRQHQQGTQPALENFAL